MSNTVASCLTKKSCLISGNRTSEKVVMGDMKLDRRKQSRDLMHPAKLRGPCAWIALTAAMTKAVQRVGAVTFLGPQVGDNATVSVSSIGETRHGVTVWIHIFPSFTEIHISPSRCHWLQPQRLAHGTRPSYRKSCGDSQLLRMWMAVPECQRPGNVKVKTPRIFSRYHRYFNVDETAWLVIMEDSLGT